MTGSVRASRQAKAAAIVIGGILAVPAVNAALVAAGAVDNGASGAVEWSIRSEDLVGQDDAQQVLGRIESLLAGGRASPSDTFEWEVGFLPGCRDVRVDALGGLVGYVVDAPLESAMEDLAASMKERGWSCIPLGGVEGATFVKEGGSCTWVLATCTQVGSGTSIVLRGDFA